MHSNSSVRGTQVYIDSDQDGTLNMSDAYPLDGNKSQSIQEHYWNLSSQSYASGSTLVGTLANTNNNSSVLALNNPQGTNATNDIRSLTNSWNNPVTQGLQGDFWSSTNASLPLSTTSSMGIYVHGDALDVSLGTVDVQDFGTDTSGNPIYGKHFAQLQVTWSSADVRDYGAIEFYDLSLIHI